MNQDPRALYCDIDPYACAWVRRLIDLGEIAPGDVTDQSVADLKPADVARYTQFHAFSGVAVWSKALRVAGFQDHRSCWTASLPCQPFSAAGKRKGKADERHLWPVYFSLVDACRPPLILGEQVASPDALDWFDGVRESFASIGYTAQTRDVPACAFGAPHIRQRLKWAAVPGRGVDEKILTAAIRRRTDTLQSTLFNYKWKQRTTPAGYCFDALRATSIRHKKVPDAVPQTQSQDSNNAPWNTPRATDGSKGGPNQSGGSLPNDASVASWPTTAASDGTGGGQVSRCSNPARSNELPDFALLANWATPASQEAGGTPEQFLERKRQARERGSDLGISLTSLSLQSQLTNFEASAWPTPKARDYHTEGKGEYSPSLPSVVEHQTQWPDQATMTERTELAAWPSPNVPSGGRSPKGGTMSPTGMTPDGKKRQVDLNWIGQLAHWITDNGPARLTVHGEMLTGSFAQMGNGGQLAPHMSRWLMGLPESWDKAAPSALSRARSSKAKSSSVAPATSMKESPESGCSKDTETPLC